MQTVSILGGTSEREFQERIVATKEKASKTINDIRNDLTKMEKLKADALKKVEEMRRSSEEKLEKLEHKAANSKDLATESRHRINVDLEQAKRDIQQKYADMKARISAAIIPQ